MLLSLLLLGKNDSIRTLSSFCFDFWRFTTSPDPIQIVDHTEWFSTEFWESKMNWRANEISVLVTNPLGISTGLWVVKWNPAKRNIAILTTGHKNNRESLACRYPRQKIVLELRSSFKLLPFLCIFLSLFTLAATVLLFHFSNTFHLLH